MSGRVKIERQRAMQISQKFFPLMTEIEPTADTSGQALIYAEQICEDQRGFDQRKSAGKTSAKIRVTP